MSIGPLGGLAASAAGSPLQQTQGAEVERAGTLSHPWALENGRAIWIARRPKLDWPTLHDNLRLFI